MAAHRRTSAPILEPATSHPSYSHSENLMNSEQFITFPTESKALIYSYVSGSVLRSVLR